MHANPGTQYLKLDLSGKRRGLLDTSNLKESSIDTLRYTGEGFLSGGYKYEDGTISSMREMDEFVIFDKALNEQARLLESSLVRGRFFEEPCFVGDSFVLAGERTDHPEQSSYPTAIKINLDGTLDWEFRGNTYAFGSLHGPVLLEDKGLLFVSYSHPMDATIGEGAFLTKLNADGEHL